jgi:esterase/lipase
MQRAKSIPSFLSRASKIKNTSGRNIMNVSIARRSLLLAASVVAAAGTRPRSATALESNEPAKAKDFTGARLSTRYRFDDRDMDLFFLIALGWGPTGGLSVGEAYYIASTIRDGDAESWIASFAASGDRQQKQADEWKAAGWKRQSAQARIKAFVSYRSAWQFAPLGPVFDKLYAEHQTAFRTAIPELGLPATFFDVSYNSKTLPGMFVQNADPRAPVALLIGGADTCFEEIYLSFGRNVFESGYSVAIADLPGQGITMNDGLHWEAECEKPISAIVDVLVDRFGAKPGRIAMLGYSLGGYFATRAAGYEKRFGAVIASTPLPRPVELAIAGSAQVDKLAAQGKTPSTATLRNYETIYRKAGVTNATELVETWRGFVADPALVSVPFLSVVGAGEGAIFQSQSKQWHEQIRSESKRLVVLDASTGGDAHVQSGNRLRLAQEICGWMDSIFG